jgi:hypothetical protein
VAGGARVIGAWPLFLFFKIFKHPKFEIQNGDLPDVQISPNFVGRLFQK